MPPPRPPLQGVAPPPVPQARPQPPPDHGSTPGGSFVTLGKEIIRMLVEMGTLRKDKATALAALAGQMTDLIEAEAQAPTPEGVEGQSALESGPPLPRSPLRSPTMRPPPGMPMGRLPEG
jgi:hypothetical protein